MFPDTSRELIASASRYLEDTDRCFDAHDMGILRMNLNMAIRKLQEAYAMLKEEA